MRSFGIRLILRLLVILIVMAILASILGDSRLFFNQVILALVLGVLIWELLRFVNKTNRELAKFFMAVKYADFNVKFNKSAANESFRELQGAFQEVLDSFDALRLDEEANYKFLQYLIDHLPMGVISWKKEEILLINSEAKEILEVEAVKNWDLLASSVPDFVEEIGTLSGEGSKLIDISMNNFQRNLLVEISSLIIQGETYQLIIFRDVKNELDHKELEAWLKLIRILTHEIMNSATPISSLTETLQSMLIKDGKPKKSEELNGQIINDIIFSLKTIQKRSDAMLEFVKDYRELTRVPTPRLHNVKIGSIIDSVVELYKAELQNKAIVLESHGVDLEIECDSGLIEQVIINFMTNAIFALKDRADPKISISGKSIGNKKIVEFADNGQGIEESLLKDIFIPFFSTREHGSGIGLSLTKQIMYMHHGNVQVESKAGEGTRFILTFMK